MKVNVPDTAFITSYYRSKHPKISKDIYANLWVTPNSEAWAKECVNNISPYESILHSLRNRFFIDEIKEQIKNSQPTILVNIGAGFSMYPFAIPDLTQSIEIDFPEITDYKSRHIQNFIKAHKLPSVNLEWVAGSILNANTQTELKKRLNPDNSVKKIILIEGVFFFLTTAEIKLIFQFLNTILNTGDIVFAVSYQNSIKKTDVFKRLTYFFTNVLNSTNNPFSCLPDIFYQNIEGFVLQSQSSCLEIGKALGVIDKSVMEEDVLNEYLYTLIKK